MDEPRDTKPFKGQHNESASQRRNELFTLIGFALGCASWGWTVIAPDSSIWFGTALLFTAFAFMLWGLWRVWTVRKRWFGLVAVIALIGFLLFDWRIVVRPQRDKPFQDLLIEGYHLTNECQSIPGTTQMPTWMRDQSKGWQARTEQLIGERLKPNDAQTWQKAIVIGMIKDEGTNAYQCLWLSSKVAALETILANNFYPNLRHRNDIGPIYWLNAVNGQVDISQILQRGDKGSRLYINGGGSEKNPNGQITVTGHNLPVKNGIITFTPEVP